MNPEKLEIGAYGWTVRPGTLSNIVANTLWTKPHVLIETQPGIAQGMSSAVARQLATVLMRAADAADAADDDPAGSEIEDMVAQWQRIARRLAHFGISLRLTDDGVIWTKK